MEIVLTIAIPVGPLEHHRRWLPECLDSILSQIREDDEIFVVQENSTVGNVQLLQHFSDIAFKYIDQVKLQTVPAIIGLPGMVNLSVGFSSNEHVLLMNSDDKLLPGALDAVRMAWEEHQDPHGWYYLNTVYSNGTEQKSASGVAMVCRSHFLDIGGYPPESAVGFPDWMFLSLMQARGLIKTYPVSDECLHWHRVHDEQETTLRRQTWNKVATLVHDTLIRKWK